MSITLYVENPVGMVLSDVDGNRWSTIMRRTPSYTCMECGALLATAYFTQRDGQRRYLCPTHVTLLPCSPLDVSGYHAPPYDPEPPGCPVCDGNDNINCPHCLPWDDQDALADWRQRVDAGQLETAIGDDLHALQPGFWVPAVREVQS